MTRRFSGSDVERILARAAAEYELVGDRTKRSRPALEQTTVRIVTGTLSDEARDRVATESESAMDANTRAVVTPRGIRRTSVDVTEADGTIRLIIRDDLSNLAAGIIGGGVGGFGDGVGFGVGMRVGIGPSPVSE